MIVASGNFTGTTSNQYIQPKIVWSSTKNTAGNYSNVTITLYYSRTNSGYTTEGKWSGKIYIDGVEIAEGIGISLKITQNSNTKALSVTKRVDHNSNGKKDITISATGAISGTTLTSTTISKKVSLDTIARASSPTLAGDNVFGGKITIYTNRHDTSFTHSLYYSFNGGSETYITNNIATSYTWTIPTSLMNKIPNDTKGTILFKLYTYSGSTNIGNKPISLTVYVGDDIKPQINSVTLTDDTGAFDKIGDYVQGISKLGFDISASGAYGSSIKSYSTVVSGEGTFKNAKFVTNILKSKSSIKFTTTVKDSRERTNTYTNTINVLEYNPPKLTGFKIFRCDKYGTANATGAYLGIQYSASITALNNKNDANYTLKYKKATEDEDSYIVEDLNSLDGAYAILGATTVIDADPLSSYNIVLMLEDAFYNENNKNAITKSGVGSSISVLYSMLKKGLGWAFGKIAELPNVLDIAFQTRFMGGILHPVLNSNTDLNDVLTPNTYVGANLSTYKYLNCPLDSGTFSLEVVGMGEEGQVKQRLTSCHKTESRAWERIYHADSNGVKSWGEWVCVSDFEGQLLWTGSWYMNASQTITLPETIYRQKSGIVLAFSQYTPSSSTVHDYGWNCFFVPKIHISLNAGSGTTFIMSDANFNKVATKYLYINDTTISGNDKNTESGTGASGIIYNNNLFVLRYVIGV